MAKSQIKARQVTLHANRQRYTGIRRWLDLFVALAFVLLPPMTGLLKFDFWGGKHYYLFQESQFLDTLSAFKWPFLIINLIIIIVSHQIGRYLCGWVCPTGVIARWGEELELRFGAKSWSYRGSVALISIVVATGALYWFVDLRVYLAGTLSAQGIVATIHLGLAGAIYYEMVRLRFHFCKKWCPSGVYFAVLGQMSRTGIQLIEREEAPCKDCDLCDTVCPIDLEPRKLIADAPDSQGIYLNGMSPLSLCIRCGDCVSACDYVFKSEGKGGVLEMGFGEQFQAPPQKFEV